MSEQPKIPTLITPEDAERLNELGRHIAEQWSHVVRVFSQSYMQALPKLHGHLAAMQARQEERP